MKEEIKMNIEIKMKMTFLTFLQTKQQDFTVKLQFRTKFSN